MSIKFINHNYFYSVVLYLFIISGLILTQGFTASSAQAGIDLVNARHKVSLRYPHSRLKNGVNHIRGNRSFRANVSIDLMRSRMANLSDYKMTQVLVYFFQPGQKLFSTDTYVVGRWKGNSAPKSAVGISMNFKKAWNVILTASAHDSAGLKGRAIRRVKFSGGGASIVVQKNRPKSAMAIGPTLRIIGTMRRGDCAIKRGLAVQLFIQRLTSPGASRGSLFRKRSIRLRHSRRVPFSVSHRLSQPGYYRLLVKVNAGNTIVYRSSFVRVLHQARHGIKGATKKVPGQRIRH